MKFASANDAIKHAMEMGWGVDVMYPKFKWHSLKSYEKNFKFKGPAKPEADYD